LIRKRLTRFNADELLDANPRDQENRFLITQCDIFTG